MIIITETFDLAFQSLLRNKLRSILTMLGIIIGVSSVILLISIGAGIQGYVTKQFESLGSNLIYIIGGSIEQGGPSGGGRLVLGNKDTRLIKRIGYPIRAVSGNISIVTKIKYRNNEKTVEINGFDEAGLKMMNYQPEKGRLISTPDVDKNARVAIIGVKLQEKLFKNESPVGKNILIQSTKYRVIGVFKSKGGSGGLGPSIDEQALIPLTTMSKQFNQDKYNAITISVANKDEMDNAKKKIETVLLKLHKKDDFTVMGQEELLNTINSILSVITAALGGIAAISLLVGGIGIMNIMFVTVTERTKEIGLRKALGARPIDILIQFLIEAITVSFVGGSIGIMISMGASVILNNFISSEISPMAILLAFGFSTIIGVVFGVIPAWKAAKMDPITALRYE